MATAALTIRPSRALADTFARLAIAAAATSVVLQFVSLILRPELDPSWRPISEYALGNLGWIMTLAFLLWGLSAVGVFAALRPHVPTLAGRVGLGFLLIGAAGPILAGIFPADPITTGPDAMSATGVLHSLGAVLGDGLPIGAALLTWSLVRNNPAWSTFMRPLVAATLLAWLGVVLLTGSMMVLQPQGAGQLGPDVPIGWQGRFMLLAELAWVIVAARSALRQYRRGR